VYVRRSIGCSARAPTADSDPLLRSSGRFARIQMVVDDSAIWQSPEDSAGGRDEAKDDDL